MEKKDWKFWNCWSGSLISDVDDLGSIMINDAYMDIHIDEVLNLPL
jgi:hypothetical protein